MNIVPKICFRKVES